MAQISNQFEFIHLGDYNKLAPNSVSEHLQVLVLEFVFKIVFKSLLLITQELCLKVSLNLEIIIDHLFFALSQRWFLALKRFPPCLFDSL